MDVMSLFRERQPQKRRQPHIAQISPTPPNDGFLFDPLEDPIEFVAWDSETGLIVPGCVTPPLVCVQFQRCRLDVGGWLRDEPIVLGGIQEDIISGANFIRSLIEDTDIVLVTHNGPFDYAVLLNYFDWDISLFRSIWKAYKAGRLRDTLIRAKEHAIEMGWLDYDPEIQGPAKFDLGSLVWKYTQQHIEGKYGPDIWRLRYIELLGIPTDKWPRAAYTYAELDPVYTADLFIALLGSSRPPVDELFQLRKAWSLYLGTVQGLATDQEKTNELEHAIIPKIESGIQQLQTMGIYRPAVHSVDRKKLGEFLKERLGPEVPRTPAGGVSFSYVRLKNFLPILDIADRELVERGLAKDVKWFQENSPEYVKTKPPVKDMKVLREVVSEHFKGNPPLTDKNNVCTARKVLSEVPVLKPLVEIGEAQKVKTTYLPVLRQPIVNPRVNSMVATGRPSYSKPNIANQPRMPGVRECWIAPEELVGYHEN